MITKPIAERGILMAPPLTEQMRAGCTILKPGEAVGEHSTGLKEEILVILQGTARVVCGPETVEVKQGNLVYIPKNQVHNVFNMAEDILKYVFIVTPVEP